METKETKTKSARVATQPFPGVQRESAEKRSSAITLRPCHSGDRVDLTRGHGELQAAVEDGAVDEALVDRVLDHLLEHRLEIDHQQP